MEHLSPRHPALAEHLRARYSPEQVQALAEQLRAFGVFEFHALPNGLYAAVHGAGGVEARTGYHHTWVRDTVQVASVAWEAGQLGVTQRTAEGLLAWFEAQRPRFEACVEGRADLDDKMQRPHIRFDGAQLTEVDEAWPHKQNDALGYALWFLSRALLAGLLTPDPRHLRTLAMFPSYFAAIRYWQDRDSGHWEETPKVQCSSVGAVVAGLAAFEKLLSARKQSLVDSLPEGWSAPDLVALRARGRVVLDHMLPWETRGPEAQVGVEREADAALLFLIHPLRVLDRDSADAVLRNVSDHLVGPHGIRRYCGDSYWMADYTRLFSEDVRTSGFEDDVGSRDRHLKPGSEAQWTLFDPLLSTIHGWRYLASGDAEDLNLQRHHLHRALCQVTGPEHALGGGHCPEAYYLADSARPDDWVVNDNTPLLWTQALLVQAVLALERSAVRDAASSR
ncbi:MAG: hypothetical protein DHS20C15_07320 [Planctomycetota bacterium]|nr:MAG: hypothetical protein DHS20C15_07320 [Planctomycetota bacterium]